MRSKGSKLEAKHENTLKKAINDFSKTKMDSQFLTSLEHVLSLASLLSFEKVPESLGRDFRQAQEHLTELPTNTLVRVLGRVTPRKKLLKLSEEDASTYARL